MTYHHGLFDVRSKIFVQTAMRLERAFFSALRENLTDIVGVRVSRFHNASMMMFNNGSVVVNILVVLNNESSQISADTPHQIRKIFRHVRDERNFTFRIDRSFNITVRGKDIGFLLISIYFENIF